MQPIAEWLGSLGLSEYADRFAENGIDMSVLGDLTDQDLKDIGVLLGHRRKMLRAIAEFAESTPATLQPDVVTKLKRREEAERRQLTVMFCDLVGSTDLSARLDPEDLADVIRAYHDATGSVVRKFDGFVAKYLGDGILVYFGYPRAHDKDAERAVRTGLAILEAVPALNAGVGKAKRVTLAVRIGIATGVVMVGETVGEGAAEETSVVGETPNVAARLQGLAMPNGLVVGTLTRELAGDAFVYRDLGAHNIKGVAAPVQAWAVTGLREAEIDLEAVVASGGVRLIGRDEEIGLLRRRWQQTCDEGRGQVVLISGEPGIGKSALVRNLRGMVQARGLPGMTFRCSPYHTNSALYPVIEHLKRAAGWQPEDDPGLRLDKLERMLAAYTLPADEPVSLIATLLSLPAPDRHSALVLTPQQLKQQTEDVLVAMTLEEAERRPVLEVWEDLQWADPSTLDLLGLLIDQAPTLPLMVLLTFRPEFKPPWPGRSYETPITLNRLERPQIESLAIQLAGGKDLPAEVVEYIVRKTDGVPLYVEELTKTVKASGILREEAERYVQTSALAGLAIPASLQEMLMARLDRLPTVRELAQLGAVLGREFAYEMLQAVAAIEEAKLRDGLGQLVGAELLYQRGRPPRSTYMFKHALIQEAAYHSLLKRTRQHYHEQVAELLESKFSGTAQSRPELVAHHLTEAGLHERAALYWQRAGGLALQRSAAREATAHFSAALAAVMKLPETLARDRFELDARLGIGTALVVTRTAAHAEVAEHYARAVMLARRLGADHQLFRALWGSWFNEHSMGNTDPALTLADELVALAQHIDDENLVLEAHHSRWASAHRRGLNSVALADTEHGIALYEPTRHHVLTYDYAGHDIGVCARAQNAITLWITGFPEQASERAIDALALARRLDHPPSIIHAGWWTAMVRQLLCEPEACRELAELTMRIAAEQGIRTTFMCPSLLGWCRFKAGHVDQGLRLMEQAIAATRQTARRFYIDYELLVFADTLLQSGQPGRAQAVIDEMLAYIESSGARLYEADAYRLRGECLAAMDPRVTAEAERALRHGIAIAESQGALSLVLRGSLSLAHLLESRSDRPEARDLLAAVYARFTEGFATHDLRCAETLLDTVR